MNDSQTADELPTKINSFVGEAGHRRNHKWRYSSESAELCESVVFIHSQNILTMLMNDSQTADELPTKIISFVGEAGHSRNHKWSNSSESHRIVRKCSFLTE